MFSLRRPLHIYCFSIFVRGAYKENLAKALNGAQHIFMTERDRFKKADKCVCSPDNRSGDTVDRIPAGKNVIRNKTVRIDHDRLLTLARVDAALERLEAGTFGVCLGCESHIEMGRLQDDPSMAYCTKCSGVYER